MKTTGIDMVGYEFQTWKVICRAEKTTKSKNIYWLCECQVCKEQKIFCGAEIRKGRTGQCKHKKPVQAKKENALPNNIKNEINNRYGKLTVISFAETKNSFAYWNCRCDCGNIKVVRGNSLRTGSVQSCGCQVSRKEEEINKILKQNNIKIQREYSFLDLKDKNPLRFDFAIFDQANNLLGVIEYQGRQHYETNCKFNHNGLLQIHDLMKKKYCDEKNIPLLELNSSSLLEEEILSWYNKIIK